MFAIFAPRVLASENVIFQDDFESYAVDTFPSAGGWQIVYNGAGNQYQVIINSSYHSPTKSLQLVGQNHWSSVTHKTFSSSLNAIGYEGYLMPTSFSYGLENGGPFISFENAQIVQWGRYYAGVNFWNGTIWSANNGTSVALQSFTQINTWYKITVWLNKTSRIFNVWINDVLVGNNLVEQNDPHEILALQLTMGWQTFSGYFDDVKVFEADVMPIPEFSSFLILPLFTLATLLAVIVHERKRIGIKQRIVPY
jgi:hypothetical protein